MPTLLVIHDIEYPLRNGVVRWAYANRSYSLERYAPDGWSVHRASCQELVANPSALSECDIVFNIDYMVSPAIRQLVDLVGSKAKMVSSFNRDRRTNTKFWIPAYNTSDYVVCNGIDRYEWALERHKETRKVCCISNGVDLRMWSDGPPPNERKFDALWTGSSAKHKLKGYHDVVYSLGQMLDSEGITYSFRPVIDCNDPSVMTCEEQRDWYHSGRTMLCCSQSEGGGPSVILESMAAGCIPVSTWVGSIPEFAEPRRNCMVCNRDPVSFAKGIRVAIDRAAVMQQQVLKTIREWSYGEPGNREMWFFRLFDRILEGRPPTPFLYSRKHWSEL